MLLVQASKDISEPGQAYKMGILEKIVNGLEFIVGLIWWTLRVSLFGQLISTLKKLFVSFLSITSIMTHWIQGNNRILRITRITWITRFLFVSYLNQFYLCFPKSSVHKAARNHKWQKADTYIHNQTYKQLVRMDAPISYSMAWSVGSAKFIWLWVNF